MSAILPINLDDLLYCRGVESERVEFKATWDPDITGPQVLKTICAFANDYHNLNGGYVVIGVGETEGRAALPPAGLSAEEVEAAQRWIRGQCNRLDPAFQPVLSPETVEDRRLLVVWAPASDVRPHRGPDVGGGLSRYWVRLGSETVNAEQRGDLLRGLIQQTARVPWDDRRAADARVEDLREAKVREFLRDVDSGLLDEPNEREVYRRMRITMRVNDHEAPRNAALLFFSNDPAHWFTGARIEVVQFAADRAGDVQEERAFGGALVDQLRDCLNYLENFSAHHLQKQHDRSQIRGWVSYPLPALRETLVNAVYHRGYDVDQPEPTKVYLYPSRVEVISYPGPVPGIEPQHLAPDAQVPPVPARNRRIGEFLKELKLAEGRLSGLPKVFQAMEAKRIAGRRVFDFDEQRDLLPRHAARSSRIRGALRTAGTPRTCRHWDSRRKRSRGSSPRGRPTRRQRFLASEMIRLHAGRGDIRRAEDVLRTFEKCGPENAVSHVANILIDVLMDAGERPKALRLLTQSRPSIFGQDAIDAAILARRARDSRVAHRYFERAGDAVYADPRALLEFAQTKIWLSGEALRQRQRVSNRRFLTEARTLLERVIQLDAEPTRRAWAWRELARTLHWLHAPVREVEDAYGKAIELKPDEPRFVQELERLQAPSQHPRR